MTRTHKVIRGLAQGIVKAHIRHHVFTERFTRRVMVAWVDYDMSHGAKLAASLWGVS